MSVSVGSVLREALGVASVVALVQMTLRYELAGQAPVRRLAAAEPRSGF